jgi:putative DNA primase/helicase
LQYIPSDSYDVWVTVGMILRVEFGENGRNLWDLWSSKSDKFDLAIQARKWSSFNPTRTGIGSLFNLRRGQRLRFYEL